MYHQILAQLFRSLRTWLVNSIKSCTKSEPYKTTLCRVLALVMFAAPLLVHAEPLVRRTDGVLAKAEALGALGDKWRTKAIPANSATGLKAKSNEAISIDEWMAENNLEPAAAPITPAFLTLNSTSIYCVYGGLTGNTTQFGEINVATGTLTPIFTTSTVGGSAALGIDATSVTPTLYYADRTTTDNQLQRYDGTTESGSLGTFTGSNPALPLLRMGFAGGTGYAIDNGNNLFSFTPSAPSTIISKGVIAFQGTSPTGTTSSGDIAFDGFGRGWAIFGNSLYRLNFNAFPVKAYPIGQVTVGGVGLVVLDGTNTGNLIGSIAFDNAGDLYLANTVYAGTAQYTKILKVSVNDATATQVGANLPNSIPDLASGNAPLLAPAIVATKSVSPTGNVKPGDILTYTIDVQNNGNAPAVVLTFTDAIPAGTTYVANSATLNGTSLAAAAYPFNTAYTINGRTASSGSIKSGNVNRATVTYQVTVNTTSPPVSVVNGAVINYLDGSWQRCYIYDHYQLCRIASRWL